MIGTTISAAKSSLMLIVLGVFMVITMLILAAVFLGGNGQPSVQTPPTYATPTPEIQYQPLPDV